MIIKVDRLVEGNIVKEDVYSLTNHPIISKKTVLDKMHIEVLKAFLIEEVDIEHIRMDGKKVEGAPLTTTSQPVTYGKEELFLDRFLTTVKEYKKEYTNWQAGSAIDIYRLRELLLPFLEESLHDKKLLTSIHHYSSRSAYTYVHPVAVALISGYIAKKLNHNKAEIIQIALAGLLMDCGMTRLPERILKKKGSLTLREMEEIKKHPLIGYSLISSIPSLRDGVKSAVLQHHERLDGSGYPMGESGNRIHPFSKVVSVADAYHAMTSERAYRKKQSPFKALELILQDDFGKFDFKSIQVLIDGIGPLIPGSTVTLSDGEKAKILYIDSKNPFRPIIEMIQTREIFNLAEKRESHIEDVLEQ